MPRNDTGRQPAARAVDRQANRAPDDLVDAVLNSSRALVAVSARSISGASSVTLAQFRMLVVLGQGATNLSRLAEALDVAPSTAMRMVDRLVEADMVRRSPRTDDRRQIQLSLTTPGRRLVRRVDARRRRDLQAILEQIPTTRRAAVGRAMTDFAAAADRIMPGISDAAR